MSQQGQGDVGRRDIVLRLEDIADASLREDGTDIPLGEQLREAAREITRLRTLLSSSRGEQGAFADVLAERHRQMSAEGWSPEHDDTHVNFEMARAAAFYALHTAAAVLPEPTCEVPSNRYGLFLTADQAWPPEWDHATWKKPKDARRNLVRAAALLVAEIERLDRADGKSGSVPTFLAGQVPDEFPKPQRRDGKEPCGECHLPTGETCDICGASHVPQPTAGGDAATTTDDGPEDYNCPKCGDIIHSKAHGIEGADCSCVKWEGPK